MEKDKKAVAIILIISFIIIAILVFLIIKSTLYKANNNIENLNPCSEDDTIKCIYYDQKGYKIVKDQDEYYVNDYLAGSYSCKFDVSTVEEGSFIVIDTGCDVSDFKIFNKAGQMQSFPGINDLGGINYYSYDNGILTIGGSFDVPTASKEEACSFKDLNTIVSMDQTVEIKNGEFGEPTVISTIELKDYLRDFFYIDCEV